MSVLLYEWKMQFLGYSRNLRLFLCFNFVWNLGLGMFSLVYNLYVKALGYDQMMVGHIVGMAAMAAAIVLVPAGIMNDRFGPKRLVSIGGFLVIAALTARSLIDGEQGLLVSAFLGGMTLAVVSATVIPFMANHSTPSQRVHLFSLNLALIMFASVIGNVFGGFLTDMLQFSFGLDGVLSLRLTLLTGVGIAALGLIPVLMLKGAREERSSGGKLSWRHAVQHHKASLQVIGLFVMLGLMTSTAGGMVVPYLNVYFEDRFGASKSVIGVIVSLGQGATALAYLIGPVIARRLGEAKAVIVLQLCSIPFLLITAFSTNLMIASGGYLFRQALMNAANPFYNTIKMKYVDRSMRGLASSSGEAVFNLGWFLASPVSTGLVAQYGSYYGYVYAFSITAVVYTVVSVLFYVFFGKSRFKPVEAEETAA
ncbi:MFS transporter [Paenibacillus tyrfis]|uniref:Major facilitator transporter n=1 Tax=Paenibacillus tyrfis TaxID=1501230 RepID=A0A081P028_9BACL|nr:MFS transporter [Paenibacillus tyrfis]KEQ24051.1 major facilitator transporter [Paenibacillus tyrfis]